MNYRSDICRLFLVVALTFVSMNFAHARRMIPDDNLAYPVLVIMKNSSGTTLGFGSGFYFGTANAEYLVTAKHVIASGLPNEKTHKTEVPDLVLELVSYSMDQPNPQRILLRVDFKVLLDRGDVKPHKTRDVAAIKVGTLKEAQDHSLMTFFSPGVAKDEFADSGLVVPEWLRSESSMRFWSETMLFCTDIRRRWVFLTRNNLIRCGRSCERLLSPEKTRKDV